MATDTQKSQLVLAGGAIGGVLLLLIGWFALMHPKLSDAATLRADAADVRDQNTVLAHKVAELKAASKDLTGLVAQLQAAANELPGSDALADLNVQLAGYAQHNHVKVTSVTAGDPQPYASGTAAASGSTTATAKGSAAGRLFAIGITLVTTGSGDDQVAFLHDVQHGARAALVTGTTVVPEGSATVHSFKASTTMTTTMQVFVQPLTPDAEAQLLKQLGKNSS